MLIIPDSSIESPSIITPWKVPLGRPVIDRSSSLSNGLISHGYDPLEIASRKIFGSVTESYSDIGKVMKFFGDQSLFFLEPFKKTTEDFSFVIVIKLDIETLPNNFDFVLIASDDNGPGAWSITWNYQGTLRCQLTHYPSNLEPGPVLNFAHDGTLGTEKWYVFGFSSGSNGLITYNGGQAYNRIIGYMIDGFEKTVLSFGSYPFDNGFNGNISAYYAWDRQLEAEEFGIIASNPFRLYKEESNISKIILPRVEIEGYFYSTEVGHDIFLSSGPNIISGNLYSEETSEDNFNSNGILPIVGDFDSTESLNDTFNSHGKVEKRYFYIHDNKLESPSLRTPWRIPSGKNCLDKSNSLSRGIIQHGYNFLEEGSKSSRGIISSGFNDLGEVMAFDDYKHHIKVDNDGPPIKYMSYFSLVSGREDAQQISFNGPASGHNSIDNIIWALTWDRNVENLYKTLTYYAHGGFWVKVPLGELKGKTWYGLGFSAAADGVRTYKNGELIGYQGHILIQDEVVSTNVGNCNFNFKGDVAVYYVWDRPLIEEDFRSLYADPFQLYKNEGDISKLVFDVDHNPGSMNVTEIGNDVITCDGVNLIYGDFSSNEVGSDLFTCSGNAIPKHYYGDLNVTESANDSISCDGILPIVGNFDSTESLNDTFDSHGKVEKRYFYIHDNTLESPSLRTPWKVPIGKTVINKSNDLSKGLIHHGYNPNDVTARSRFGKLSSSYSDLGQVMNFSVFTDTALLEKPDKITEDYSFLCLLSGREDSGEGFTNGPVISFTDTNASRWRFIWKASSTFFGRMLYLDQNLGWNVIPFVEDNHLLANKWYSLGFSSGSDGVKTYTDGNNNYSLPHKMHVPSTINTRIGKSGGEFDGKIAVYYAWNRKLTDEDFRSLYADPFQLYKNEGDISKLVFDVDHNPGSMCITEIRYDSLSCDGTLGIIGDLNSSEVGDDQLVCSGSAIPQHYYGDLNVTEIFHDVISCNGTNIIVGDFNATEIGNDQFVCSGSVIPIIHDYGDLNVTEVGHDILSCRGLIIIKGDLSLTEIGKDQFACSGSVIPIIHDYGDLNATEIGYDNIFCNGTNKVIGYTILHEEGLDVFASSGYVTNHPSIGYMNISELGKDTITSDGSFSEVILFLDDNKLESPSLRTPWRIPLGKTHLDESNELSKRLIYHGYDSLDPTELLHDVYIKSGYNDIGRTMTFDSSTNFITSKNSDKFIDEVSYFSIVRGKEEPVLDKTSAMASSYPSFYVNWDYFAYWLQRSVVYFNNDLGQIASLDLGDMYSGTWYAIGFSAGPGGGTSYTNGNMMEYSSIPIKNYNKDILIGRGKEDNFNGDIAVTYIWDKQLTAEDFRSLYLDPFQLYIDL